MNIDRVLTPRVIYALKELPGAFAQVAYYTRAPRLTGYNSHLSHLFFIITSLPPEMSVYLLRHFFKKSQCIFFFTNEVNSTLF